MVSTFAESVSDYTYIASNPITTPVDFLVHMYIHTEHRD